MMVMFLLSSATVLSQEEPPGPYVDSQWFRIITNPDAQLYALLTHQADAGLLRHPWDFPSLVDAGFTITSEPEIGYSWFLQNNRVWPTGTPTGSVDEDPYGTNARDFRRALNRLIDKDMIVEDIYTVYVDGVPISLKDVPHYWLPPGQRDWINYNTPLPTYDPIEAYAILDAAGFVWNDGHTCRIDPRTGGDLAPILCYIVSPEQDPLGFEMAAMIAWEFEMAGIPVNMAAISYYEMYWILANDVLDDYQLMIGFERAWDPSPDTPLFDFSHSQNVPLWNIVYYNDTDADYWATEMMSTFDDEYVRYCGFRIQEIWSEDEPFMPLLRSNDYAAFTGPYDTQPGALGIVNMAGCGSISSHNTWGKMLGRSGRVDPVTGEDINIWILPQELTSLNPTIAFGESDWHVLNSVLDPLIKRTPYTWDYWPWAVEEMPRIEEWTGPNGEPGMTMEFTVRHYEPPTLEVRSPLDYENSFQWGGCKQAYSSNNKYAKATKEGAVVTYKGYGFEKVTNYIPIRVEVGVEGEGDGDDYIEVQVSWDGGGNWTSPVSYTPPTNDPDAPTYLDVTDGRIWIWDDLNAANFRVKVTKGTLGKKKDLKIDWLPVRVTRVHPGRVVDVCWHDGEQVLADDCVFALNLLRFQNNIRYRSVWEPIYDVVQLDTYRFRVYYLRRFPFAFEGISDVALFCPRHIWEPWIDPVITPGAGPEGGDVWTGWARHHSEWRGWEELYVEDPQCPGMWLTHLIGCGPFKYHHGAWEPNYICHVEANRNYFAGRICPADVNLDGIVDDYDEFQVLYRLGASYCTPRWHEEIFGMQGPAADIAYPCQFIGSEEICLLQQHYYHRWGPRYPPFT